MTDQPPASYRRIASLKDAEEFADYIASLGIELGFDHQIEVGERAPLGEPYQLGEVRVGTSGWNYPSGKGTWNGLFYPKTRSKRAGTDQFDELRFYAEHFDTVEVNSTFYGQPRAEVTSSWAERTPPGFDFSLKLYQKFTHPKMFREAALKTAQQLGARRFQAESMGIVAATMLAAGEGAEALPLATIAVRGPGGQRELAYAGGSCQVAV